MSTVSFKAKVHFLTEKEGGRSSPARQGYRPSLHFDDGSYFGLAIPRFFGLNGRELKAGDIVPAEASAEFRVANDEAIAQLRKKLQPGESFDLTEGARIVARAVVLSVSGS